jgi:hypothetical protein
MPGDEQAKVAYRSGSRQDVVSGVNDINVVSRVVKFLVIKEI